jgi:hypothetical protein
MPLSTQKLVNPKGMVHQIIMKTKQTLCKQSKNKEEQGMQIASSSNHRE